MSRRQARGGAGMNRVNLRAVGKIPAGAGGEDFHFAVHDFIDDAATVIHFQNLPFASEGKTKGHNGDGENRQGNEQVKLQKSAPGGLFLRAGR